MIRLIRSKLKSFVVAMMSIFYYCLKNRKLSTASKRYLRFLIKKNLKYFFLGSDNENILRLKKDSIVDLPRMNLKKWSLNSIPILFINLNHRIDRKNKLLNQFNITGIQNYSRFEAIKHSSGILGCGLSHLEIAKKFIESNTDELPLIVCEDDVKFMVDLKKIDEIFNEFMNVDNLDVLCLGHNSNNSLYLSKNLSLTTNTQTTSFYVCKKKSVHELVDSFKISVELLKLNLPKSVAALDIVWKEKQIKLNFAIPSIRVVIQDESYSDIEKKMVLYKT